MITFGLITEGLTDQIVIENILHGYFNTEPVVNPLQPERDKDNDDKSDYGGWTLVFKYFQERASVRKKDLQLIIMLKILTIIEPFLSLTVNIKLLLKIIPIIQVSIVLSKKLKPKLKPKIL
jgi:hypothetical protein